MVKIFLSRMVGGTALFNPHFGVSENKSILLSDTYCYGSEASLLNCRYSVPSSSCDKYDIAGVVCAGMCQNTKHRRQKC